MLCACTAVLCFISASGFLTLDTTHAEDYYYTGVENYTVDSSSDFGTKVAILSTAFPSGWYWNRHTVEELNGKQQIKVIVNGKTTYRSEVACTGPTAEQKANGITHAHSDDRSICQSNRYNSGWQCQGFAWM